MGLFSKKEQKEKKVETEESKKAEVYIEEITKVNIDNEYPYIVQLNDVDDGTILRRKPFGAKRYIEGANVYLVNEKIGFKEPFPNNSTDYKQYTLKEIERRLQKLSTKLDAIRNRKKESDRTTPEELDIVQEIKRFRGYQTSHLRQGNGSYMIISQEHGGRPLYTFDRKGNFKLPVYKNTDNSLLYTPTETEIATASELLDLNDKENGIKDNSFKMITMGMVVILALSVFGIMFLAYKTSQVPVELVDGMSQLVQTNIELSTKFGGIVDGLDNVTSQIGIKTPEPTATPKGVIVND